MANSYVSTSLSIDAPTEQLQLLIALVEVVDAVVQEAEVEPSPEVLAAFPALAVARDDLADALRELLSDQLEGTVDVDFTLATPTCLDVVGEESPNVDLLAACIRVCCPSALPLGFTFSTSSDRPSEGAFSGGWMLVTAAGVMGMNATTMIERIVASAREAPTLDPVQKAAFDAYARDGIAFGVDVDGMGAAEIHQASADGGLGDGLLPFVLNECSDAEGDFDEAARMMDSAAEQLGRVADALREAA